MSAVSTTEFDAHIVERNVKFVVNDNQSLRRDVKEAHECRHGLARHIHVGRESAQNHLGSPVPNPRLRHARVQLVRPERGGQFAGQMGDDHLAHVVTVSGVIGPGITEPDYQPRIWGQVLLRELLGLCGGAR